ncbi:hypothetical protein AKJ09_06961 [Labilithrix luteola]|uniref:Uncharacterized protein n=1 Tax=Labilithrix luteola TaxID=1391654 RepID=A0A0K1Q3J0_9BACT|nr:hypothetical protein AKJ09_06961 [Labilithrix luteola]
MGCAESDAATGSVPKSLEERCAALTYQQCGLLGPIRKKIDVA